jgi:hypothetical protein
MPIAARNRACLVAKRLKIEDSEMLTLWQSLGWKLFRLALKRVAGQRRGLLRW